MREILFRGKRVGNGEWIEGYFLPGNERKSLHPCIFVYLPETQSFECFDIDIDTLGEYTGLTDKNGEKIFENDICRFDNDEPNEAERYTNYVIQWDIVNCRFVVVTADNCEDVLDRFFSERSEIIANLHDNPELLEGRQ